jgi:hypothetical protein
MRPLKSLSFDSIRDLLSSAFHLLPDRRAPDRIRFSMHDTLMAAFAMFFFHHPSLLSFQRAMQEKRGISNLQTIFYTHQVPSDSQMREILDSVPVEPLRSQLPVLFNKVRRAGWTDRFTTRFGDKDYYTVALDGTQYFHSTKIECPGCLRKQDESGTMHYCHQVVAATLVKANSHQILPIDIEAVRNADGTQKQDCEINAAKRLLPRLRQQHPRMNMIVGGDDLYAHEPFVELINELGLEYVLVAKPLSHKEMFEWVEELEKMGETEHGSYEEGSGPKKTRRQVDYRIARGVPLSGARNNYVQMVEAWVRDWSGKDIYHNSWITELEVNQQNVATIIKVGRSRWKIENEQFNVHKNGGYELEHNYGHGQKNLSMVLMIMNLIAFVAHQILEMGDRLYQQAREKDSLREIWNGLRMMMRKILFRSWEQMMRFWTEEEPELSG